MRSDERKYRRPGLIFAWLCMILSAATALAHPLGNFSVILYSKISVGPQSIEILYLVDMAEIPTYQELRQFDLIAKADDPKVIRYLDGHGPLEHGGVALVMC